MPSTIIDKVWGAHVVSEPAEAPALLYIDLHLVHEVTSPQAFDGLRARGLSLRRPEHTFATADHSVPTTDRSLPKLASQEHRFYANLIQTTAEINPVYIRIVTVDDTPDKGHVIGGGQLIATFHR